MNFKQWLESEGAIKDPWEAMTILGLIDKAGQPLNQEELMIAYRRAAMQNHPDREGGSHEAAIRVNAALDILKTYVDRNLPTQAGTVSSTPITRPTRRHADRPRGSETYTDAQFKEWVRKLYEGQYFQFYKKTKLPWLPMTVDGVQDGPVGSREMSRKLNPQSADELEQYIRMVIGHDFRMTFSTPEAAQNFILSNICYLGVHENWKPPTAWITYIIPKDREWERDLGAPVDDYFIRCLEFDVVVVKPKVKPAADALKSRSEIESYLYSKRDSGIRKIPTTTSDSYWGLDAHMVGRTPKGYLIEITNRNFSIVKRYTVNYGYKKETRVMKLQSIPFSKSASKVTPAIVDAAINWVKQKYEKHGLGEEKDEQ